MVPMPPAGGVAVGVEGDVEGGVGVAAGVVRTVLKLVVADDAAVADGESELRVTGAIGVYIARGSILIEGLT